MPDRRPVALDLFSGAGGFSLGFEQAGYDVLASADYDPIHCAVHAFNFPRTQVLCQDVRTIGAEAVRSAIMSGWRRHGRAGEWDGEVDVIVGGPPCQGFSVIGKRQYDDVRNELVFSFSRLVAELRPRHFVMENVPGMTSLAAGPELDSPRLLDVLLEELEGHGYEVASPTILNAAQFGVPQQRQRLILLGARFGCELPAYPTPETEPRRRRPVDRCGLDLEQSSCRCPTVSQAIGDLPDVDRVPTLRYTDETQLTERALARMRARASGYARVLLGLETDRDDYAYRRIWETDTLTSSLRTVHASHVIERFAATAQGHPEPVSRFLRLHPNGVSPTLRAGTHYERGSFNAPRPIHPTLPRVISVREAARLHSFPDWFRLHWTKWHGFRQVGNAIPPRMARAIGRETIRALGISPTRPKIAIPLGDSELVALENLQAAVHFQADMTRIPRNALRKRVNTAA